MALPPCSKIAIPARVACGSTLVTAPNSARTARGPPSAVNGARGAGSTVGGLEGALDALAWAGRGSGSLLGARAHASRGRVRVRVRRVAAARRTQPAYTP